MAIPYLNLLAEQDMQQSNPEDRAYPASRATLRPLNVLLCPDQPDWAFDNIAKNIKRFADPHRISKLYMADVASDPARLFGTILSRSIDVCHIFWREDMFRLFRPEVLKASAAAIGIGNDAFARSIATVAFTTSVYDHLFSSHEELAQRREGFAAIDGYTVSSARIQRIYQRRPDIPAPDTIIPDGVDTDHFSPRGKTAANGKFTIGWAGNSAWGKTSQGYDVKGFTRLFQPMINHLRDSGHDVQTRIADPTIKRIPFAEMPDFYRGLDVFVCTSAIEGTPNPVLEAMACGIPVVSTDVGIVPEVFGPAQRPFMIAPPQPQRFADAIVDLIEHPETQLAISAENRQQMLNQTWEKTTKAWWPFWENCVAQSVDPRTAYRRETWMAQLMRAN